MQFVRRSLVESILLPPVACKEIVDVECWSSWWWFRWSSCKSSCRRGIAGFWSPMIGWYVSHFPVKHSGKTRYVTTTKLNKLESSTNTRLFGKKLPSCQGGVINIWKFPDEKHNHPWFEIYWCTAGGIEGSNFERRHYECLPREMYYGIFSAVLDLFGVR